MLTGGEDHQLLAAFELPGQVPGGWTVVGGASAPTGPDGRGVLVDDAPVGAVQGWQSFGPGT